MGSWGFEVTRKTVGREINVRDHAMFDGKKALLLDMNGTFMFGEDRFDKSEDFSRHYKMNDGALSVSEVNDIVLLVYNYLDERYSNEIYRHNFPSVEKAIYKVTERELSKSEIRKIADTFAFHELGYIPDEYVKTLFKLEKRFILAVVIDIWSPKDAWIKTFKKLGINGLFSAYSFSSDHGIVKPSPEPFELVLRQLGTSKEECLVIGDSPRRDLGGAIAAGIDCILVGGANSHQAPGSFPNLIELGNAI